MPEPHFRCSDDARARGDRSIGTAPPARNWFLVEQDGSWGPTAWHGLQVDEEAKEELEEILDDADARLMLIRRPGRNGDHGPRRWCVVRDTTEGAEVSWGTAADDAILIQAARLFEDPTTPVERIDSPTDGTDGPAILLVCTHGRKDVCCAVRGRPVAEIAAELWPEAAWECTHTGGDRFAGNIVLLPDGACYGGLDPEDLQPLVSAHLRGAVDPTHLRGATGYNNRVQAAMVAAYAEYAPLAFDAVRPVSHSGRPHDWQVRLNVRGIGLVEATGHTETTEPELLTCKADVKKVMQLPIVDGLTVIGDHID